MRPHRSGSAVTSRSGRQNVDGGAPPPRAVLCRRRFGVLTALLPPSWTGRRGKEEKVDRERATRVRGEGRPCQAHRPRSVTHGHVCSCHGACARLCQPDTPTRAHGSLCHPRRSFVGSFPVSLVPGSMTRPSLRPRKRRPSLAPPEPWTVGPAGGRTRVD